jgi:hypothetical protein
VGLVGHGAIGVGLAGEIRPDNPYDRLDGLQGGARLEWRWDRYSFALTDYYGYSDFPTVNNFNGYSRNVNSFTGYPLDNRGRTFGPNPFNINPSDPVIKEQALNFNAENLQLFNVLCSAISGSTSVGGISLGNQCALAAFGSQTPIALGITGAQAVSFALTGGQFVITNVLMRINPALVAIQPNLTPLNPVPPAGAPPGVFGLSAFLTVQQQALLGCGAFYGTNCHNQGIDLFNAEASVLLQAFPMFEPGGPVGTRFVNGTLYTLPGACGPFTCYGRAYNPLVDGCVNNFMNGAAPPGTCKNATTTNLLAPFPAGPGRAPVVFNSVMDAVSYNFLQLLTVLSKAADTKNQCNILLPQTCSLVAALFAVTGTQRPNFVVGGNGIFGRRDFLWAAGSEIDLLYPKRNILGFSTDFAQDTTKSNWGIEFSWSNAEQLPNGDTFSGHSTHNTLNLTVSVDRPTFINFLNANRTFFFNTQWFTRYIVGYQGQDWMGVEGPFSLLGTFTASTGYFQDRLLPTLSLVHDVGSTSGGALMDLTYRYSENFSISFGVATFYGKPHLLNIPLQQAALGNNGPGFDPRIRYDGLSILAEQDQFSFRLRYTF